MSWKSILKSNYKKRTNKKDRKVKGSSIMDIRRKRIQRKKEEKELKEQREKELWEKEHPIKECERCGQKKRIGDTGRGMCEECEDNESDFWDRDDSYRGEDME